MAGLIWAGIGKGLSDAGESFGRFMAADIADKRQAAREEAALVRQEKNLEAAAERQTARDAALLERQEALAKLRAEQEEAKREAEAQRRITQTGQAMTKADEIAANREKAKAAKDAAAIKREDEEIGEAVMKVLSNNENARQQVNKVTRKRIDQAPSASGDEIAALIRNNPQAYDLYEQAGLINKSMMRPPVSAEKAVDPRLQRAIDEYDAALQIGAHSTVVDSIGKKRDSVLAQIREENRYDEAMKKLDQRSNEFDRKIPIEQQKADAATTNANRPRTGGGGSGGGPRQSSLETKLDTLRKLKKDAKTKEERDSIQRDIDDVRRQMRGGSTDSKPVGSLQTKKDYSTLWK